ncbi:MAG: 4-hydroxy-tetrahydrodipicolinate synthase [Planctomycetota bacterium]|nr:4-hydroxy-tetrahydrodipicolinate synthase [Planctomycetota bacterium]
MSDHDTIFRGVFTALVTPFTQDGAKVDVKRLKDNIRVQSVAGVKGVVPCGTTGESPTLSEDEHRLMVETTTELARENDLKVIAGAGANDTKHAIQLHRLALEAGADASLQVNPYYNKPSQAGLYGHFMAIADSCDLPIVLYNIPGRTGVCQSIETIVKLAQHPNIVAIKDATGGLDLVNQTVSRTDLAVLSGDDPLTLPMASIGGQGVISVLSNLLPGRVAAMWHAIEQNEWTKARAIHQELYPIATNLLSLDSNPVPLKAALALEGKDTGTLRLPLAPPSEHVIETLRILLKTSNTKNPEARNVVGQVSS